MASSTKSLDKLFYNPNLVVHGGKIPVSSVLSANTELWAHQYLKVEWEKRENEVRNSTGVLQLKNFFETEHKETNSFQKVKGFPMTDFTSYPLFFFSRFSINSR